MANLAGRNLSLAMNTLRSSRSRSFFTMLGVIIAVAAVTTVVSIGDGIKNTVTKQTNLFSKNVITIKPATLGGSASGALSAEDAKQLSKIKDASDVVTLKTLGGSARGDNAFNGVVFAVNGNLPNVVSQQLAYGGFFSSDENTSNMAVLGAKAADKMFNQDVPLGRSFSLRGQDFVVTGVLSPFAPTPLTDSVNFNSAIFVPDSLTGILAPNGAPIYEILVKADSSDKVASVQHAASSLLLKNHGGERDFQVLSPSQLATSQTATLNLVTKLILAAAIITLLVSGVGIMNVMLVSVTERIHEIGIRKAVGAANRQILTQFLTEAVVLSVFGSLIGVIVAALACLVIGLTTSLSPHFDLRVAGLSSLVAIGFGVLFGTIPAARAARKDPISALRSE